MCLFREQLWYNHSETFIRLSVTLVAKCLLSSLSSGWTAVSIAFTISVLALVSASSRSILWKAPWIKFSAADKSFLISVTCFDHRAFTVFATTIPRWAESSLAASDTPTQRKNFEMLVGGFGSFFIASCLCGAAPWMTLAHNNQELKCPSKCGWLPRNSSASADSSTIEFAPARSGLAGVINLFSTSLYWALVSTLVEYA